MMDEEIPVPLPSKGSEDARDVIKLAKILKRNNHKNEEEEEEADALQWTVRVVFTKGFTEKEMWACFEPLINANYEKTDNTFPGTVHVIGFNIINAKTQEFEQVELFTEEFIEEQLNPESKPAPRRPLKAKKVTKVKRYPEVVFLVKLINPTIHSSDFMGLDDEDDDEEDEENLTEEKEATEKGSNSAEEDQNEEDEDEDDSMDDILLEPEIVDQSDLQLLLTQIKNCVAKLDKRAKIQPEESVEEAAKRAEKLAYMADFCDHTVCIELVWDDQQGKDQKGFLGVNIFDVMLSMGFEYDPLSQYFSYNFDDMPLIEVTGNNPLDHFSVENLSSPDKTFPCILFEVFLPQCTHPVETSKAMINAAKYAKKRLGGTLVDYLRRPFKEKDLEKEVKDIVDCMKACGISPGSEESFELF